MRDRVKAPVPYLHFEKAPRVGSNITDQWRVLSRDGLHLGFVFWFTNWRRYTFQAHSDVVLDAACLAQLAEFVKDRTDERKTTWKAPKAS